MWEALQKETVDWQLREMGYVPGIYVYGMTDAQIPCILNFTREGIDFLEMNTMCSEYVGHSCIDFEDIEGVSFKKGFIVNTLTILVAGGGQYKYNVANRTMGASWQKENMIRMRGFLQGNFPCSYNISKSTLPVWMYILIPVLGVGIYTLFFRTAPQPAETVITDTPPFTFLSLDEFNAAFYRNIGQTYGETWIVADTTMDGVTVQAAEITGHGYQIRVISTRAPNQSVVMVNYTFDNATVDNEVMLLWHTFMMGALIRSIEPDMTEEDAGLFLSQIALASGETLISPSHTTYQFVDMGAVTSLRIELPINPFWLE